MLNSLQSAINTSLRTLHTTDEQRGKLFKNCLDNRRVKHKVSAAFILATVLLLGLAATALAVTLAGHQRVMQPENGFQQATSCTIFNDTLYMNTNDGLMLWNTADSAPELLLDSRTMQKQDISYFSLLFHSDTAVMLLDEQTKTVWRWQDGAFAEVVKMEGEITQFGIGAFDSPVVVGETLFVHIAGTENTEFKPYVWRIDLQTGSAEILPLDHITEICGYWNGQLLALQYSGTTQTILAIDTNTATVLKELSAMSISTIEGIAYDADTDSVYAMIGGTLSQWSGSQWLSLQSVSIPDFSFFFGVMDETYVAAGYDGVQFIDIRADFDQPTLVIRGYRSPFGAEDAYVQASDGIQIKRETMVSFSSDDVDEAIQTGDDVDIFLVRMDKHLLQIMQNGEFADLSQSSVIRDDADHILPIIRSAITFDGRVYALPYTWSIGLWMMRDDAEYEQPLTLQTLLLQHIAWRENPRLGELYLANDYNVTSWEAYYYVRYAVTQAYEEATDKGQLPDFGSEAFQAFLQTLQSATLSTMTAPLQSSIVTANASFMLRGREVSDPWWDWRIISPPAVTVDQTDTIHASMIVYVLNPNSKNKELAMDFLEYAALHRSAQDQAMFFPDTAEPSFYAYALAPGFEGLQSMPDSWEVSARALAQYRTEILPHLSLSYGPYSKNYSTMYQTILSYLDAEITLEQCTERLNALAAGDAAE